MRGQIRHRHSTLLIVTSPIQNPEFKTLSDEHHEPGKYSIRLPTSLKNKAQVR